MEMPNSSFEYAVALLLLGMIAVALRNLIAVYKNIQYFLRKHVYKRGESLAKFYIVVPLMDEVASVGELVETLTSLNYPADKMEIVLATTIRERDELGVNPTHQAAAQVVAAFQTKKHAPRITVVESTKTTGYVATQIAFAVTHMSNRIHDDDFILIYNADSSPGKDTLLAANAILKKHGRKVNVMQQSSLFTKNIAGMVRKRSFSAVANAIHQSLWTLKHEVSMTRRQSIFAQRTTKGAGLLKRLWLTRFTVCVGHGLFVRKRYYDQHPLNEDASIEDTQYGLYQSLNRISVYPVPILENSESPSTLARVIAQKRTWFKLIFDLSRLFTLKAKQAIRTKQGRVELLGILGQVSLIYITWFTHSLFLIGSIVLALLSGNNLLIILACCFYTLYWLMPAVALAFFHSRLVATGRLQVTDAAGAWILGAPAIMSHSVGPWLAVVDKLRGTNSRKKTER